MSWAIAGKFLLSNWKQIVGSIAAALIIFTVYDWVYDRGYRASETKYKKAAAEEAAAKEVELKNEAERAAEQKRHSNKVELAVAADAARTREKLSNLERSLKDVKVSSFDGKCFVDGSLRDTYTGLLYIGGGDGAQSSQSTTSRVTTAPSANEEPAVDVEKELIPTCSYNTLVGSACCQQVDRWQQWWKGQTK